MNTGRALIGSAFIAVGGLVLLDQTGALDAGEIIGDWWPVLFLLAAVLELLARPARKVGAVVFGTVGLILLGLTTDVIDASAWEVIWPVLAIAMGLWLIVRPSRMGTWNESRSNDDRIDATAVFSGRRVTNTGTTFRRGEATAIFGGVEVDLTRARLAEGATLEAVALFGGVEIEVPEGWRILLDGPAIFGGHENHVPVPSDPEAPTLRINATAIFGGVDVKARVREPVVQA